jgi:hypothetical protein
MLSDGLEGHLLNALFGRRFYAVTINYPVTDPIENDGKRFYESILIMNCCGKDVPDSYGMEFDTPIPEGPAPKMVRQRRT